MMFHRHAGQQQPAGHAAGDLHAVLADHHRLHAILAAGLDRLRSPQDPHVHVELAQLDRGDGRKAGVVGRRPIGRTIQRMAQRNGRADVSAAGAEPARPPQRDERPVHRHLGRVAQQAARRFGRFAAHGRHNATPRRAEDGRLLLGAELRPLRTAAGFRWLGGRTIHGKLPLQCKKENCKLAISNLQFSICNLNRHSFPAPAPADSSNRPAIGVWQWAQRPPRSSKAPME